MKEILSHRDLVAAGKPGVVLLNNNFDVQALRTNAVLRKDEWLVLDRVVVEVARRQVNVYRDLVRAGLTTPVGGLGTMIREYEKQSDMTPAEMSMSGITQGRRDVTNYTLAGVPVPIFHKDITLNLRTILASRRRGTPIDTTNVRLMTRLVVELIEDTIFQGGTIGTVEGYTLHGLATHPHRLTGAFAANEAWNAGTKTGEEILTDVLAMMQKAVDNNYYGPYALYIPVLYQLKLAEDFKANSDLTIRQRLLQIPGLLSIRSTKSITGQSSTEVILVQLSPEVIDVGVGQDLTVVQWDEHGGLQSNFKVLAALAPTVKSSAASVTGIVHYGPNTPS